MNSDDTYVLVCHDQSAEYKPMAIRLSERDIHFIRHQFDHGIFQEKPDTAMKLVLGRTILLSTTDSIETLRSGTPEGFPHSKIDGQVTLSISREGDAEIQLHCLSDVNEMTSSFIPLMAIEKAIPLLAASAVFENKESGFLLFSDQYKNQVKRRVLITRVLTLSGECEFTGLSDEDIVRQAEDSAMELCQDAGNEEIHVKFLD